MLKINKSTSLQTGGYTNEFERDLCIIESTFLLCTICNIKVVAENIFPIQQHVSREKYINGLKLMKKYINHTI